MPDIRPTPTTPAVGTGLVRRQPAAMANTAASTIRAMIQRNWSVGACARIQVPQGVAMAMPMVIGTISRQLQLRMPCRVRGRPKVELIIHSTTTAIFGSSRY